MMTFLSQNTIGSDHGLNRIKRNIKIPLKTADTGHPPSDAASYYASSVHPYFGINFANKGDILADKRKYYRRWPQRNYHLVKYTVVDRGFKSGVPYMEVILEVDWHVSSRKRGKRSGHSTVDLTLQKVGNSYKITAIRNAKIQRNITAKSYDDEESETGQTYAPVYFSGNGVHGELNCRRTETTKTCTVTATNDVGRGKGGISISFPGVMYRTSDIVVHNSRGFGGKVNFYSPGSLLWSTQYGRKINAEYLLLEGWSDRWSRGYTKSITFSVHGITPPIQVRAVVVRHHREYIAPTDFSQTDQQGYPVTIFRYQ